MHLFFAFDIVGIDLFPGSCVGWFFAGLIGGWLAGKILRGKGFGLFGDLLIGLVGAFLAAVAVAYVAHNFLGKDVTYHFIGTTILAFAGALVLGLIVKQFRGKKA
jgi:uncharacterized membrane protein YeaQ/YmgE (transglycosylase-associated protein family)